MDRPWNAEVELSRHGAAGLIAAQFPALAPVNLEPLGAGWDSDAYLVNGVLVFRFPRREIAVPWIEKEVRWLPRLAPLLPAPIPVPSHVGVPADGYPFPFAGYEHLPGTTACSVAFDSAARSALASQVGPFLRTLHSIDPVSEAGEPVPGDDIRRADLARRRRLAFGRVDHLEELGALPAAPAVRAMFDQLVGTPPWPGDPVWVHGDLYARHLLVDPAGTLLGVIDWGDCHRGDPALDLGVAFSLMRGDARAALIEAYGAVDRDTLDRARLHGLNYGVILLDYGLDIADAALEAVGRAAIAHALV